MIWISAQKPPEHPGLLGIEPADPNPELLEDQARACFCEDAPGAWGWALDLVKEAHRNAARRILRALADKVQP